MNKIFLTSTADFVSHDLIKHIDLTKGNKLAFINTAAEVEDGDKQWLRDDKQSLVDVGFDVFDYTITGKTREHLEKDLSPADVLYLSGGNTFYLLQQSHLSGFFELVQELVNNQGKIYIGTSAGSIIAGPRLPEYLLDLGEELIDEDLLNGLGYGLVNFTILPHWGSDGFKDRYLNSRMKMIYQKDQSPLVLLTDNQYMIVEGDTIRIVDVTRLEK